eukprot:350290-Prymnesium_polylepis.1
MPRLMGCGGARMHAPSCDALRCAQGQPGHASTSVRWEGPALLPGMLGATPVPAAHALSPSRSALCAPDPPARRRPRSVLHESHQDNCPKA